MFKEKRINVLLFILTFMISTAAFGQNAASEAIDNYIKPFAEANHFSGVVLASKDGKVIYEKAFGFANAEHRVPNRKDTKFSVASVTKPMTSVILIRLIEAGKIGIKDKLSKYVPDFPNGDKITIEMLGRHRSGIPHRVTTPMEETVPTSAADMVEKVKKTKLVFEPGSQRLYSSAGYAVLARVLEIASGKTYSELLKEYVLDPAEMSNTVDFKSGSIIENRSEDYFLESVGYVGTPLKDFSFLVGAGSVFSTANDIYIFGKATIDGKYGNIAKVNLVRNGVFSSNGSTNGFRCNVRLDSTKKYGYVVISNLGSGSNDLIINNVRKILEGNAAGSPEIPNPKIDRNTKNNLGDYVGNYKLSGSGFEILINRKELYAGPYKLLPLGKDRFYSYWSYAVITFVRSDDGSVKGLKWNGSFGKSDWTRQ